MKPTRRDFLAGGVGFAASLALPAGAGPVPTVEAHDGPPAEIGHKFNADGSVRRYPGNTIISPVDPASQLQRSLVAVHDRLRQGDFARRLAFMPPSSYHMTIFGGALDQERGEGVWPRTLPADAPLEACSQLFLEKLQRFDLACDPPFRFRFAPPEAAADPRIALKLEPVDAAEEKRLRDLRDRLAAVLELRQPDHDSYFFHISLHYLVDWMNAAELADYRKARADSIDMLRRAVPLVEMGPPKFCLFEDMFAFPPLLTLRRLP